jgi:hypothetical protein
MASFLVIKKVRKTRTFFLWFGYSPVDGRTRSGQFLISIPGWQWRQ